MVALLHSDRSKATMLRSTGRPAPSASTPATAAGTSDSDTALARIPPSCISTSAGRYSPAITSDATPATSIALPRPSPSCRAATAPSAAAPVHPATASSTTVCALSAGTTAPPVSPAVAAASRCTPDG